MPPMQPVLLFTEILYTLAVAVLCGIIYLRTRESYTLTKHPGIGYFRDAFLFLGLSYVVRLLFALARATGIILDLFRPWELGFHYLLLPIGYFSTLTIFFFVLSAVWRQVNPSRAVFFSHVIAGFLSVTAFVTRSQDILLALQFFVLVLLVFLTLKKTTKRRQKYSHIKLVYLLFAITWLLNLWTSVPRRFFPVELQLVIMTVSLLLFYYMHKKVSRWVK